MSARKFMAIAAATAAFALTAAGCGGGRAGVEGAGDTPAAGSNKGALIGVAMPTKTSERWIDDGDNVKAKLESLGYKVDLQYANDSVPQQQQQIESMLNNGAKALIVASIDGTALTQQLADASGDNVKVIAYDRLINGSPNVDYYVTFDNEKVGVQQGTSLLTGLGILGADGKETGEKGPFNIELFAGSPDDNNAQFFFKGAMSVVQPYIDNGTLKVVSGQTDFSQVAIQQWKLETAQARMENLLNKSYASGTKLDGVLSPYDGLSRGILNATKAAGIPNPVVTGQDAEKPSDKLILDGVQYSTIFKDTRKLGDTAASMVDDVLNGRTPETNDTTTYDNKVKVVPAYLHQPVVVTKDNLMKEVVDTGYYTKDEVEKGE
ncbi:monosaccharide ABC transporter substrate-binding protein, CUT2 family [Microlunatus sagamiharensis]|uniref:Monosaccharide ABC transporter substrate-binding protein, CUT2 family n=1 Tax=Microlunatus sagamiharensis TaxID=546874 RepID=A0A1H2LRZ6_9ACTN|nr:multiple monosaccharide ABC transporter substrate-binding protein [Microlunatus sagamiharensis]SDU83086.1 monosaccharide ABC transporter substrate-binding protein, CUT2 family [Microlunatus sagamiharensis]